MTDAEPKTKAAADASAAAAATQQEADLRVHLAACTPCAAGRSTNGISGYPGLECPECKTQSYCLVRSAPCRSCEACTIAEYTTGEGATEPSRCISRGAAFGFKYLSQCSITWVYMACILMFALASVACCCYCCGITTNEINVNQSRSTMVMITGDSALLPDLQMPLLEEELQPPAYTRSNDELESNLM